MPGGYALRRAASDGTGRNPPTSHLSIGFGALGMVVPEAAGGECPHRRFGAHTPLRNDSPPSRTTPGVIRVIHALDRRTLHDRWLRWLVVAFGTIMSASGRVELVWPVTSKFVLRRSQCGRHQRSRDRASDCQLRVRRLEVANCRLHPSRSWLDESCVRKRDELDGATFVDLRS